MYAEDLVQNSAGPSNAVYSFWLPDLYGEALNRDIPFRAECSREGFNFSIVKLHIIEQFPSKNYSVSLFLVLTSIYDIDSSLVAYVQIHSLSPTASLSLNKSAWLHLLFSSVYLILLDHNLVEKNV
ncbi:hypothetical protein STEG23_006574 [Scotinomys teguina]